MQDDSRSAALPRATRRQQTEAAILEAALDVFSTFGFRGATLDQIAEGAGMSKPNLLYYFPGKDDIHARLLGDLLDSWLDPLRQIDPEGDPATELRRYVQRKLAMSRDFPRESRLFANEILNGAPRLRPFLEHDLRPMVAETVALIRRWSDSGRLPPLDPLHLLFSIWALTQHYADFAVQVAIVSEGLTPAGADPLDAAGAFLDQIYARILST